MNRPILFRGKSINTGEWIQGDGIHYPKSINYLGTCWIDGMENRANDWIQVDPATVGQFTGLYDKDGVKIFEGDVVFVGYGEYYQGTHEYSTTMTIDMSDYEELNALCNANVAEVIGNIHDTSKLAKEESEWIQK